MFESWYGDDNGQRIPQDVDQDGTRKNPCSQPQIRDASLFRSQVFFARTGEKCAKKRVGLNALSVGFWHLPALGYEVVEWSGIAKSKRCPQ